jgi:hypothetical protein
MASDQEKIDAYKRRMGFEHMSDEELKRVVLERLRTGKETPNVQFLRSQMKLCK